MKNKTTKPTRRRFNTENGTLIIKLVNAQSEPVAVKWDIQGMRLKSHGAALTLCAPPDDTNSINDPNNVIPVVSKVTGVKNQFDYTLPADSIVVLTVH